MCGACFPLPFLLCPVQPFLSFLPSCFEASIRSTNSRPIHRRNRGPGGAAPRTSHACLLLVASSELRKAPNHILGLDARLFHIGHARHAYHPFVPAQGSYCTLHLPVNTRRVWIFPLLPSARSDSSLWGVRTLVCPRPRQHLAQHSHVPNYACAVLVNIRSDEGRLKSAHQAAGACRCLR